MRSWSLLSGLALAACSAGLPTATSRDVAIASQRWPDATETRLNAGRSLYVKTCAGCHSLKAPAEVPPTQWAEEIREMRQEHGVALSDDEAALMAQYLFSVGSRMRGE